MSGWPIWRELLAIGEGAFEGTISWPRKCASRAVDIRARASKSKDIEQYLAMGEADGMVHSAKRG